jgi:hypothetical protein
MCTYCTFYGISERRSKGISGVLGMIPRLNTIEFIIHFLNPLHQETHQCAYLRASFRHVKCDPQLFSSKPKTVPKRWHLRLRAASTSPTNTRSTNFPPSSLRHPPPSAITTSAPSQHNRIQNTTSTTHHHIHLHQSYLVLASSRHFLTASGLACANHATSRSELTRSDQV